MLCGVIRVVRNYTRSTKFSLSSLLESRIVYLNRLRLDAISILDFVINKRRYPWCSALQHRGTKRIPPGLECVEEMLSESRLPRWTCFSYSRSIPVFQFMVNHSSQGQNKSAKSGMNLRKKTIRTNSLQKKREDTKDNGIFLWNKAGKNGPVKLRPDYRAAVMMNNRLHHESREPIEEPIHPGQQRRIRQGQEVCSSWPTYRMAILAFISKLLEVVRIRMELEGSPQNCFFCSSLFFVTVGFVYSWLWSTVTDGVCGQNTLTPRIFSHICTHFILVNLHRMAQGVARRVFIKERSSTCHHMSGREAGTTCKECTSQWRSSRGTGRVSIGRTNRWWWNPCRLWVDWRWLHPSSSQWTPKEETIPIPLKYNDVTSLLILIWMWYKKRRLTIIGMSIRVSICQIRGKDSRNLLCWKRSHHKDFCGAVRDWQTTTRPDYVWPEVWTKNGWAAQNREKMNKRRAKLESARKLRGIYFIDPDDR